MKLFVVVTIHLTAYICPVSPPSRLKVTLLDCTDTDDTASELESPNVFDAVTVAEATLSLVGSCATQSDQSSA